MALRSWFICAILLVLGIDVFAQSAPKNLKHPKASYFYVVKSNDQLLRLLERLQLVPKRGVNGSQQRHLDKNPFLKSRDAGNLIYPGDKIYFPKN